MPKAWRDLSEGKDPSWGEVAIKDFWNVLEIRLQSPRGIRDVFIAKIRKPSSVLASNVGAVEIKESEVFVGVNRGWIREQCAVGQKNLKDLRLVCWKLKY